MAGIYSDCSTHEIINKQSNHTKKLFFPDNVLAWYWRMSWTFLLLIVARSAPNEAQNTSSRPTFRTQCCLKCMLLLVLSHCFVVICILPKLLPGTRFQGPAMDKCLYIFICPTNELRERLGIDDTTLVLQENRLRQYRHLLWKDDDDDWVKKCMEYKAEGPR